MSLILPLFQAVIVIFIVILKEGEQDFSSELAALQKEGEMPIEDLLATLPEALLSENAAPLTPSSVEEDVDKGIQH